MTSGLLILLGFLVVTYPLAFYAGWLLRDRKHKHYQHYYY